MTEPTQTVLTPAQVEVIEELIEDREARLIAYVNESVGLAVEALRQEFKADMSALQQQVTADLATAVKYGERLGLRATNQQTLSAVQSDFAEDVPSIRWEWRQDVGQWESFTVERGTS